MPKGVEHDTVGALIAHLESSRLLEPPQLDEVASKLRPRFQDPRALARHLIERGWLTAFQLTQVFQGRGRELTVGPYVLLDRIGEGGMGQVYKARHKMLNRTAALKVIRKEWLTQGDAVKRFQREIRAASQLSHVNIVHTFDAGQLGETHYIAMEFIQGVDLAHLVKTDGPLPVVRACDYARQAALGLQHAHEKGMIHRDIKPGNLLLSDVGSPQAAGRWGTIKILDMGLARIPRPTEDVQNTANGTLTQVGSIVGTPDYLSPEQARDAHTVDIRADLYSLGCTLFFLLTGEVPFPGGTNMEKVFKHQLDPPPSIEQRRADVSADVSAVVARLLAKRPEERFQVPADVATALAACITAAPKSPTQIRPGTAPQSRRLTQTSRDDSTESPTAPVVAAPVRAGRRRMWLLPVVAVLLLGGVLLAFATLGSSKKDPANPNADAGPGATGPAPSGPKPFLDTLRPEGIPAAERLRDLPPEVVAVLGEHRLRSWGTSAGLALSPDGRSLAVAGARSVRIWDTSTGEQTAVLPGTVGFSTQLRFSPDGKTLTAFGTMAEPTRSWDIASRKLLSSNLVPGERTLQAVSPDGQTAIYSDKVGLVGAKYRLWDMVENRERAVLGEHITSFNYGFTPGGKFLYHWSRNLGVVMPDLVIRTVADGKEHHRLTQEKESAFGVAVGSDGETVALGFRGRVEVWNSVKREKIGTRPVAAAALVRLLQFTPDNQTLLLLTQETEIHGTNWEQVYLCDAATLRDRVAFPRELGNTSTAQISADGKLLALGGFSPRPLLLDLTTGKERFPAGAGHKGQAGAMIFSPDGRNLLTAGSFGETGILSWDLATAKNRRLTSEALSWSNSLASNQTTLVTRSPEGFTVWDAARGQELGRLTIPKAPMFNATVAPNGKVLATHSFSEAGVRLYDVPSLQPRCALQGTTPFQVYSLAFSDDGQCVVTSDLSGKISLWDAATGKARTVTLPTLPGRYSTVGISPNGKWVSAVYEGQSKLWNAETGQEQLSYASNFTRDGRIYYLQSYSPSSDKFLLSNFQQYKVWDIVRRTELPAPKSAGEAFTTLAWSPDGKRLACVEPDGRISVWEAATGQELGHVQMPGPVGHLVFAPDGRHLATSNSNGTIYILRLAF